MGDSEGFMTFEPAEARRRLMPPKKRNVGGTKGGWATSSFFFPPCYNGEPLECAQARHRAYQHCWQQALSVVSEKRRTINEAHFGNVTGICVYHAARIVRDVLVCQPLPKLRDVSTMRKIEISSSIL
jgi:hypothetical protein